MKKIFTLALAAMSMLAANAMQPQMVAKQSVPQKVMRTNAATRPMFAKGEKRAVVNAAEGSTMQDTVHYSLPDFTFHQGYTPQGMCYYGSYIIASMKDSLNFRNDSKRHNGYQYGWTIDGDTIISNDDVFTLWGEDAEAQGVEADMMYTVPTLVNDVDTYQFGSEDEDGTYIWTEPQEYIGMTKIDLNDKTVKAYSWSADDDYFMGTKMLYGQDTLDTYVVFFGTPNAEMAIDTISLFFWSHVANPLPATGMGLQMLLFDETTEQLIGSYNALASDIAWQEDPNATFHYGQLSFPIKANITGQVSAYLTGFNNPGVSIGCFTDDNYLNDEYEPTFIVYNQRLVSFGNNIALFFNSKFGHDPALGIRNNREAVKAVKTIENGQVVIRRGDRVFNALGKEISK